ncbi:urease subunit alpha [Streptosporangium sp. NBC_01755]|uniref:urease subunit alpha n=1 Tax=unclassified Streptosporangium TaxID=2632669 RepID=UPI002DDA649A|nr:MULTISPECIES: urease subunit alpha [unclassified Streptosporangium]WSA25048.1 urease subunit alpha [Streptosporangium sp. NBC_01810]WSD03621.1 urease subunit alpha [Streptosporangium sp. NBC_01755]
MTTISRKQYASMYGPTVGDRIRLGDTNLVVEVEKDHTEGHYGDEAQYGGGKTARDGMSADPASRNLTVALDVVITNAVVIDPMLGIVKGDIGIKDGRIAGIGKAGNPHTQNGVDRRLVIGAGTEVISGENLIATAGAIDTHVHFVSPQQAQNALSNGITTLVGGGTGPADGTRGTTCTPGPWNIARILQAYEGIPINVGVYGKGNSSLPGSLEEQIRAGACGLKVHEDWGSTPAVIDCSLSVADEYDIQITIHTDTLNEAGFVEDTISAINGRAIHTYHSEGAGGGHAPDILRVTGEPNVLPASTNPTLPYTVNSVDELLDMTMVCHHLSYDVPEDVAFAESRVRAETISAETVLHDLGIISMIGSDSQAMGRVGESFTRAFQIAHHCKDKRGALPEDSSRNDNFRVLRYLAKLTINPARTCGMADTIGSLEDGKLADIVLWQVHSFGAKPFMVVKGGMIGWAQMGDPNASLPTPQPVYYRPMYGAFGTALKETCVTFMSQAGINEGVPEKLGLERLIRGVRQCRTVDKRHMLRNSTLADIMVDPETYKVSVNGKTVSIEPAGKLPLNRLYFV